MAEATAHEVTAAARIVACLRCLRRSRAYDFTRHIELERLFALIANGMGLQKEGLYVQLPRDTSVHPYPVHVLVREVPTAVRRPFVGRTRVIIRFRDTDETGQALTSERLGEMLKAGAKGALDSEEVWTDPRFGDRIVSEVLWENATPLWPLMPSDSKARAAQFAWAALQYEGLQRTEAHMRKRAELRGEDPDEERLSVLNIKLWPNSERTNIELDPVRFESMEGPRIVAKRTDLRNAVEAVSLAWPVRTLERVLKEAEKLEPQMRKRPRIIRLDILKNRGARTLTQQLAYWLVEAPGGPRFTIEEARDALGMKSRQALWNALRGGREKHPSLAKGGSSKRKPREGG